MKLLIIGINYAPEETGIAPYTTGMARHFARRGHEVRVMTGVPHYPLWKTHAGYRGRIWLDEADGLVGLMRSWHYVPSKQSALKRGFYEGSFLATSLARLRCEKPDAVIGIVPSLSGGLLARVASKRFNVPYGVLFQDLMGRAAAESGVDGANRFASAVRRAEHWAVARAASVAVIADGFRPYVESLGVPKAKVQRVRNWVHIPRPNAGRDETRERYGLPRHAFVCLHAGNMGYKQGLENVINAAVEAEQRNEALLFVLMGDGNRREELQRLAVSYDLHNVRFLPIQPEEEFANLLAAADVLLMNQKATVTDMSLPGKLTSYFYAGRPVVAAVSDFSETAREIRAAGGGIIVLPDSPVDLLEALIELRADPNRRRSVGEAARLYAEQALSAEASFEACDRFLAAITGATTSTRETVRQREEAA